MIDFSKLPRPASTAKKLDPIEIFGASPSLANAPNDLWNGQAEALKQWHMQRDVTDTLIQMNTGSGKSIVGVLIAQSLVNEEIGPIVYCCNTIDLIHQTAKECDRLGLKYTTRISGDFSNQQFETGNAFCITSYQSAFVAKSPFRNELEPKGLIFDDAHVAERIIRDAVTLRIDRESQPQMYNELIELIRPEFHALGKNGVFSVATQKDSRSGVLMCPPGTAFRNSESIKEALKRHKYSSDKSLLYPAMYLWENIGLCAIFVSNYAVEITPPFMPTSRFSVLNSSERRVYLSATLEYTTDFVRAFGRRPALRIEPPNDAGNGERLILLESLLSEKFKKVSFAHTISQNEKILIAVPSYQRASAWSSVAVPPKAQDFSAELDQFRRLPEGAFCLVSRLDGIDLPHGTCRIMLIDGLPVGRSLLEEFLFSTARVNSFLSTKMAVRITQLLGRINRGRSDYGAFVVCGRDANVWLKTNRNIALLPELIRKQLLLGSVLQENSDLLDNPEAIDLIEKVLSRKDQGWLKFYKENVDGLEVDAKIRNETRKRETELEKSALAEANFMSRLWEGDPNEARGELEAVLDDTAIADGKLAGWYSVWLGMAYEIEGDQESANKQYRIARSRLTPYLPLPVSKDLGINKEKIEAQSQFHQRMLELNLDGAAVINDVIAKLTIQVKRLCDRGLNADDHEDAVMRIGELLGFGSFRPDADPAVDGGPDNLWTDSVITYALPMELKTGKVAPVRYFKKDIGQSHNHIQWVKDNYPDYACEGVIIVGPDGACAADASPPNNMFHCNIDEMVEKIEQFVARLEDSRGRIALDKWNMFDEIGKSPEWNLQGWFKALAKRKMADM